MVDIVLINPAILGRNYEWERLEEIRGVRPPLPILSLGSYLEHEGYDVKLMDVNPYALIGSMGYLKELEKIVGQGSPILIGLSVMTSQIVNAYFISQHLKELNPDVPIVWGGIHPTLYPSQTSIDPLVDFVIYGPGEDALSELIQHLERKKEDFKEIKNLSCKGKVNPPRKPMDVNDIPFLNYDLLNVKFYVEQPNHFLFRRDIRMLPLLSSRGCPYSCSFCINNVCRTKWRAQTAYRFLDELEFIVTKYKLDAVRPLDENFFISKRRTEEIIEEFSRRKVDILWGTNVRADYFRENYINIEMAKKLNKFGFTFASIGAESGSDRVLRFIKKGITTSDILSSAKICHESNIIPVYSWMIGMPTQTKEEMLDNIRIIKKIMRISPASYHHALSIYRPFPGGELYDLCKEAGLNEPKSLKEWVDPRNLDLSFGSIPIQKYNWIKDKDFVQFIANYTQEIVGGRWFRPFRENQRVVPRMYSLLTAFIKMRFTLHFFNYPNLEKKIATYLGRQLQRVSGILKNKA